MTNLIHLLDALLAAHVAQGKGLIMGAWETHEGSCVLNVLASYAGPFDSPERKLLTATILADRLGEGGEWGSFLSAVMLGWDMSVDYSREQIERCAGAAIEGAMVGETLARKYHWSLEYKGIRSYVSDESTALLYDANIHPGLKPSEKEVWESYARKVARWGEKLRNAEEKGLYWDVDSVELYWSSNAVKTWGAK